MYSVYSERQTDCEKAWLQDLQIHLSENVCVQTFLGTSELKKNMLKISYKFYFSFYRYYLYSPSV